MRDHRSLLLLSAAACAALSAPVAAQQADQAPAAAEEQDADTLQIVVTARRREESFLDVPVVATVLDQATLERSKTDDLYAISTRVPSLLLGDSVNSTGTQLSIRGIGTMALNATMDQSVSLNVDGMPISQGVAYSVGMFDVAQVEVLKGPQALFFGKNSTAGVIALRTADPGRDFEAIVRVGYEFDAKEKQVDVILSGPVSDVIGLRFAGRYSRDEGFFRNTANPIPGFGAVVPDRYTPTEDIILRGTAVLDTGSIRARLKLNYSHHHADGTGSPLQVAYCPEGTGGVAPQNFPFLQGENCKLDGNYNAPWFDPAFFPGGIPNGGRPFDKRQQIFGTLDFNADIAKNLSLSSITGFYTNDFETLHLASTVATAVPLASNIQFDNAQFTQEVRLSSDYSSPLNFMIGAFYQTGTMHNEVRVLGNSAFGFPGVVQNPRFHVNVEAISAFAQLTWDIAPRLELSGGARWVRERREVTQINKGTAQGAIGKVAVADPYISSANLSPEVSLTYKATGELTAFASYKTGYKSGSFNTISFVPEGRRLSFNDEKATGGEVGLKLLTRDGRLRASAAAYYYKYDGLQLGALEWSSTVVGGAVPFLRTINAASSTVKGAEFEINYLPAAIRGFSLTASAAYNRARYDSFANAPCDNGQTMAQGCNQLLNPVTGRYTAQDLSGRPLVRAPEWMGFVGFNQTFDIGADWSIEFGSGLNYVSKYSTVVPDIAGFYQQAFAKLDANLSIGKRDGWEFSLIGRNLTNRFTTGWCANTNLQNSVLGGQIAGGPLPGPAGRDEAACYVDGGRQIWLRASARF